MQSIASWGRLQASPHQVSYLHDRDRIPRDIGGLAPGLAHGMGRSYGDVCLNPGGSLWITTGLDKFIDFDPNTGLLSCEAGVLLRDIQRLAIPRGWILPVTPGTQLVTLGGAIANDVHGKNHHVSGTFGDHLRRLRLVRTDGSVIDCGPDLESGWFAATLGGMGLTGVITEAVLQLKRVSGPWLETETLAYRGLDEFFELADGSEADWEHTVSWIDCLSSNPARGPFMRANPSDHDSGSATGGRQWSMPFVPPVSLVNRLSLRPFNAAYFRIKKARAGRGLTHYEPFFYPLDGLLNWNRMYGPNGFYQYQAVLPRAGGADAISSMLTEISRSGEGSFLAVLKTFADRPAPGMLSFAMPGVTLALDLPNRGSRTLRLFDRLDAIVREAEGRLYPAKDARMPRDLFETGYPGLADFLPYRDPGISAAMSRRLMGT